MRWLKTLAYQLRSTVRRERADAELHDELRFHVERQTDEYIKTGMSREEARLAARRTLGGLEQIKEECRDTDRIPWLETLVQDVRFAIRTFRRRPGFALSALTILAFGVGSSTAIFSVVNGVLLTPLPYRDPGRLVRIFGAWEHGSREGISPPDFADYRDQNTAFESVAAATNSTPLLNLKTSGEPEQVPSRAITSAFFSTLGIQPLVGREFRRDEEQWGGPRVAILTYGLWQRRFGGDSAVVGGPLTINGLPYTIVGVLPPFFNFLGSAELFTPVQPNPVPEMRESRIFVMIGRLRAGVDAAGAQNELDVLARRLLAEYPKFDRGWSAKAAPLTNEVVRDVKPALLMLLAALGLVVLLVSANVAGLMLAQAASRRAEISLRMALGASRGRVIRQLMTESLTLAFVGGALGCAVGYYSVQLLKRFGPVGIPRLGDVTVDVRVLAFTLIVTTIMGVLFGLEPAWRAGRVNLAERMSRGGRAVTRAGGLRNGLVLAEVTISVVLVLGAGLAIRTLLRLEHTNPGFQTTNILTTRLALPGAKYNDGDKLTTFWDTAIERIETIPSVASAAITSELPLGGMNNPTPKTATTAEGKPYLLYLRSVSPNYVDAMQIPLRKGRMFSRDDRRDAPRVVVINEQFQQDVFGAENPIGQRLTFNFQERAEKDNYQAVIVGVVGNVHHTSLATPAFREAYMPVAQSPLLNYDLVVRTKVDPTSIATALRQAVWSIDSDQSIGPLRTVEDVIDLGLAQPKFRGIVLGAFALVALVLAAAGLYGLLSFLVAQRQREIGLRISLGASPGQVVWLILNKGMALTLGGVCVGWVASLGLARVLSRVLPSLVPAGGAADPLVFLLATSVLLVVAFAACYLPACRAARLDPIQALRVD
ncbi:MAG TPA: ABC transporter permease [Vicinamibacterales bacterium]|nr:ABC transporter permease [Vicinamibacterales bacterium]